MVAAIFQTVLEVVDSNSPERIRPRDLQVEMFSQKIDVCRKGEHSKQMSQDI
jgi:hypothetical protein